MPEKEDLLEVEGLSVRFSSPDGDLAAVDGIDFSIRKGEIVALVGESGSGKSLTALSLTRLLEKDLPVTTAGRVVFEGRDLMSLKSAALRSVRGKEIAYVFQEPSNALNPVVTVGRQMREVLRIHTPGTPAAEVIRETLLKVGISEPERRMRQYPSDFSGGQLQRVLIGMALLGRPRLLIADEPTTSLDVATQRQILQLLSQLRKELNLSILFITHHLGILNGFADRMLVMHRGKIVEHGETREILANPSHPYTRKLIASIPRIGSGNKRLGIVD